jgi:hypothetical protein
VLAAGRVLTVDTPDGLRRQAFGGELVDVAFAQRPSPSVVEFLDSVSDSRHQWVDDRTLRLIVDDGGTAVPEIIGWTTANDVEVGKAELYVPPFDDIFVELVERLAPGTDETPATDKTRAESREAVV